MSKYTVELRWLVEQYANEASHQETDPFDEHSWPDTYAKLGLANYPIFEESYRETLNNKIIRHFFVREIGFETAGLFRFYMNMKMQEIMPYYNQLYNSELLDFDPLLTRDMTYHDTWKVDNTKDMGENWSVDNADNWSVVNTQDWTDKKVRDRGETWSKDETITDSGKVDSSGTQSDREIFQDTPMSFLDNSSPNAIESLDYATTVTYTDGKNEEQQTSNNTRTDKSSGKNNVDETDTDSGNKTNHETGDRDKNESGNKKIDEEANESGDKWRTEKGRDKSGAELLQEYRETFLNIDMMIINELETLFMGIG